jgi:thiol-disulfide isomerase/thioredoxin
VALWLAVGVVIVLQVMILQRLQSSDADLAATRALVTGLQVNVRGIDDRVDALDENVAGLSDLATQSSPGEAPSNQVSVAAGSLPPFTDTQNDAAVVGEYVLGELTANEYYTDEARTIAPADGTARVWLVWAHWCPYCQQELPDLAQWWPENAERFPNTKLVTVSTSMDETRGNPLTPYLEESQFPFPVLMDPDLQLASQFGTSAFPFWVVTDGEGRVVFRVAGAVGLDTIEAIFTQVEALVTGT